MQKETKQNLIYRITYTVFILIHSLDWQTVNVLCFYYTMPYFILNICHKVNQSVDGRVYKKRRN